MSVERTEGIGGEHKGRRRTASRHQSSRMPSWAELEVPEEARSGGLWCALWPRNGVGEGPRRQDRIPWMKEVGEAGVTLLTHIPCRSGGAATIGLLDASGRPDLI